MGGFFWADLTAQQVWKGTKWNGIQVKISTMESAKPVQHVGVSGWRTGALEDLGMFHQFQ